MSSETHETELEIPSEEFELSKQIFIGDEQIKEIEFRERSIPRTIGFVLLCIFTVGLWALLCFWLQRLLVIMRYKKTTPKRATKICVIDMYGNSLSSDRICYHHEDGTEVNIFTYKKLRYSYNDDGTQFTSVQFNTERPFFYYETNLSKGLRIEKVEDLRELNGENSIEVPVTPLIVIVIEQALHPFIVFQVFSIIIWSMYDYYYYASLVGAMTILSVVMETYQTRVNMNALHEMTEVHDILHVFRRTKNAPEGEWVDIPCQQLVPGDVYEITNGHTLTCDTLLLPGAQAIMNETMLTGESVPIVKTGITHTALPSNVELDEEGCITEKYLDRLCSTMSTHDLLKVDRDKTYVLFAGTKVIRVRGSIETSDSGETITNPALGVALRIGFSTAKGQLVRSILFPKPTHFQFYTDSFKFIGVLACMALVGFIVNAVIQSMYGEELLYIFLKAGDLVTTVVPPTLPAVLAAGTSYALSRLKQKNIYCIDSMRVNMAGKLKVMCFDKTGTLTEEDLSVLGAMSTTPHYIASKASGTSTPKANGDIPRNASPDGETAQTGEIMFAPLLSDSAELTAIPLLQLGMTCCHSVANVDGLNVGDPLDVKMFEFTKWKMIEKGQTSEQSSDVMRDAIEKNGIQGAFAGNYEALVLPPDPSDEANPTLPAAGKDIQMTELPDTSKTSVGIIRRFEFSSHLQRQSVIVERCEFGKTEGSSSSTRQLDVFVKGSPEMVSNLCDPTTIPADFETELSSFTHRGLRVIALAHRTIPIVAEDAQTDSISVTTDMTTVNALQRPDVEQNLTFLGFFILENKLRPISKTTLGVLNEAGVRSLMITGDNPLTAINIAKECGLIPSPPLYVPSSAEESSSSSSSTKSEPQLVHPLDEYPVFLAELKDGKIFWRCFDYPQWTLNPTTLEPVLLSTIQPETPKSRGGDTSGETGSVYSVSSTNTNGRANVASPSPSVNSASGQSVNSTMTPNPSMSPSTSESTADTNASLYSFEVHSTAGSIASVPTSVVAEPEDQKSKKVFNPFAGWTGGPYGPMYWNRYGLPRGFYSGPQDQPPPSCYFMAVTGAAFRHMYNEEQEKIKTLERLNKAPHSTKDAAAAIAIKELEDELMNSTFKKVCYLSPVFARMTPDDKANLVETLIALGHITGMCGDGANDCGALKAAHVGISLSEVEASIAAPFTSKVASIACVTDVILEGRGSLASSFEVFKATAIFAMIQFLSAAILIGFGTMLTDFQYLAIDVLMTLPILFTIGYTKPHSELIKKTPIDALVSWPVISSLFCHVVLSFVIQMCGSVVMRHCFDYEPISIDDDDDVLLQSHATTSVYYSSLISYYFSAVVICLYNKYLQPVYKNWLLLAAFIFVFAFAIFNFAYQGEWWADLMQMKYTEDFKFYRYCIIMCFAYTISLLVLEYFVCQNNLPKIIRRTASKKSKYEPTEKKLVVSSGEGEEAVETTVVRKVYKKPFYALLHEMEQYKRDVEA